MTSDAESPLDHTRFQPDSLADDARSLHAAGVTQIQSGHPALALDYFNRAEVRAPKDPEILCGQCVALIELGRYQQALEAIQKAILLAPQTSIYFYYEGNALAASGQHVLAIASYRKALQAYPYHPDILNNLSGSLQSAGDYLAALECHQKILTHFPEHISALNNISQLLIKMGRFEDAPQYIRKSLTLDPDSYLAQNNMGVYYHLTGDFVQGTEWYRRALETNPHFTEGSNNLSLCLLNRGDFDGAIKVARQVVALKNDAESQVQLALALLSAGQFEEGWSCFEQRWQTRLCGKMYRHFRQPQWRGEPARGQTLFIYAEQGFGDTLQFSRYVPMAVERGFRVIVEMPPELAELARSLGGIAQVIRQGNPLPEFDLHCPVMSLAKAFGTTPGNIPSRVPYLFPDTEKTSFFRQKLASSPAKMKIGLAWKKIRAWETEIQLAVENARRSIDASLLMPIASMQDIAFYSLQKDGVADSQKLGLIDWMDECHDFSDTAALIQNLDLVISIDTSVAHLAGAIGRPVWMLDIFSSCWRWERDRDSTKWYPNMRIFRQIQPNDWKAVIERVRDALLHKVARL